MKNEILLSVSLSSLLLLSGCHNNRKAQVRPTAKDGESCLIDHKCKMVVRRWESGGNVYYRCLVDNTFYNVAQIEEVVIIDLTKCENINP